MSARPGPERLAPSRWVGAAVKRVEDPRLLTGRGRYLDDLGPARLLHAAFVRSPHAHARVVCVDAEAARALPGVAAVLAGRDLTDVGALAPRLAAAGFAPTAWAPLAPARVRFAGEPVAVVAARSAYVAADAAELVGVEYEPWPALAGIDAALAPGAPALHEGVDGNVLARHAQQRGDVAGAFARAAHVVRETFDHGRVSASPLEARGVLAHWEDDALTVWASTQVPFVLRAVLARLLGLPESRVRVVAPDTGGGFGQKMHVLPEDLAVAVLSRATGRPVKWTETRHENLVAASQAREQRVQAELAADADGRLLALRARVCSDAGAYHVYPLTASLEPIGTAGILPGPYRVPAYAFEAMAVATNKPPIGAYRGVGMTMGVFVMERMLDLLAERLAVDPVEIRRENLIRRDEYPYTSAAGFVYDSGDLPGALDRALALAGYPAMRARQAEARRHGRLVGIGVSCYVESTGIGARTFRDRGMVEMPGPEAATVRMEADGSVRCLVSYPSQGQGHATTVAQIVADRLGVAPAAVRLAQPDTAMASAGSGTFASRGAVAQMVTVERAAAAVRAKLLAIAAGRLEASAADLILDDGRIAVRGAPDRAVALGEIARLAHYPPAGGLPGGAAPGLEATVAHDLPGPTFAGAAHVAEVEVDADTGRVAVTGYTVVEDCGPLLNPMIVEGQVHGAVVQGIGEALSERLVYDETGQAQSGTFMEYGLPQAADVPALVVDHVETPSPLTPGGVKGVGEGGTVGAPAAVANGVADAVRPLGIRVIALPILAEGLVGRSVP
ncbi:MAG: xanthine dehydrogenase family protein molybdopterin-binding subunit [Candidatus Rokuibacteriota bacterium]